jgi:hypothetical protein
VNGTSCRKAFNQQTPNAQNIHVREATVSLTVSLSSACEVATRAWLNTGQGYRWTPAPYTDNRADLTTLLDFVNIVWQVRCADALAAVKVLLFSWATDNPAVLALCVAQGAQAVGCGSAVSGDRRCMVTVCEFR